MKKPSEKKQIKSPHYKVKALLHHSVQYPTVFEDKETDQLEISVDHLTAYIDRITQAQTDGYWSVLREL